MRRLIARKSCNVGQGLLAVSIVLCLGACGSRSEVLYGDGTAETTCFTDPECAGDDPCVKRSCIGGFCRTVSQTVCNDGDDCTIDRCEPNTGQCEFLPRTADEDGDGHRAPLLGSRPGEVGACGDDCDDTSALAHPGGGETCDGVDNDCNGVIDDQSNYGSPTAPVLVSLLSKNEAMPISMAFAGDRFAMTTVQRDNRWRGYFQAVDSLGFPLLTPLALTSEVRDGTSGPLVWTGALFGTAWEDRRDKGYDIYFNRLDANGKKLGPDVRVTESEEFSLSPTLLWDGSDFILANSEEQTSGLFRILVRRLNHDGSKVSASVAATGEFTDARAPRLIQTDRSIALFYQAVGVGHRMVLLGDDLKPIGNPFDLAMANAGEVSIRWNRDRFWIAWSEKGESPGKSILAMTIDANGKTIALPRPIVAGTSIARTPAIVPLGDRAILVWADDYQVEGTFELSAQTFDNDLTPLAPRTQLTRLFSQTSDPIAVLGNGTLGVAFRSRALGSWQTFFLSLSCAGTDLL